MGKTARIWVKNELKHMSEMFSRLSHSYNEIEFHYCGSLIKQSGRQFH